MNKNKKYVLWFEEIDKGDVEIVGGKGANLGEMTQAGFPVPPGFVITADAYRLMIEENNLQDKIKSILKDIDVEDPRALNHASKMIEDMIEKARVPAVLEEQIFEAYDKLGDIYVAVRSSATAEDLPEASFAGQQETYLNIKGDASLIVHVRKAWASLFEPRAIYYRTQQGFDHFKVALAIPVQKMVQSDISGIMFTINPVTNDKSRVIIEAIWGLGEKIVQGAITPDHYEVNKHDLTIHDVQVVDQTIEMTKKEGKTFDAQVPPSRIHKRKLSDEMVVEIARYGKKLQQHYFFPQDSEWAIENGKFYIVQTRPITTIAATEKQISKKKDIATPTGKIILTGDPASPGIAIGIVNVLKSAKDITKIKAGDILVTDMTTPDFVPAMKKAVAIVTNKGGQTSHAAIVSRELGVPCIVGTKTATTTLKQGHVVQVDGATGHIHTTNLKPSSVNFAPKQDDFMPVENNHLKTATKVYVNLGEPELAARVAQKNVDGVGLLRAEFMIAGIGTHPKKLLEDKKGQVFTDKLAEGMAEICKAFGDRPVVYRATDFKTNEYKSLKGGAAYEPDEPNPLMGYRGAYRYISDPSVFELELEAIKKVRNEMGYKNLHLMIPFVRNLHEMREVKKIVVANGLSRTSNFKLWMMVEIPVNVILLDQFIDIGIDGVSVGTNDLTMLMLGTDRDNETVRDDYDERNPAVLWALEHIIKTCHKKGITVSVCGQAPSTYPDVAEFLCRHGVTSVSVTPDVIDKTRQVLYDTERRLLRDK